MEPFICPKKKLTTVKMKDKSNKDEAIIVKNDSVILFFNISLVVIIFHPILINHAITNIRIFIAW